MRGLTFFVALAAATVRAPWAADPHRCDGAKDGVSGCRDCCGTNDFADPCVRRLPKPIRGEASISGCFFLLLVQMQCLVSISKR